MIRLPRGNARRRIGVRAVTEGQEERDDNSKVNMIGLIASSKSLLSPSLSFRCSHLYRLEI